MDEYGDVRHRSLHALEHALDSFLGNDQLAVLEVQRVEDGVQPHLAVSHGSRAHLRRGEVQLEEGLLEVVVVHCQTRAFLSGSEDREEESPKEGVLFGEVHCLGMRLEANSTKDVICVGEEIAALSLWERDERNVYVVNAGNSE